jgi:hypothetical protein
MSAGDIKIIIDEFWTVYKPDPMDGSKMIGIDMIKFGPLTQLDRSKIQCTVSSLRPAKGSAPDSGNPTVMMAHDMWDRITPAYEAWKKGQELPEDGTPLAAWNGVSPQQAVVLKAKGIKTVESIAGMGDGMLERLGMPGMRDLIRAAQAWLTAADTNQFAQRLLSEQKERETQNMVIADLSEQNALQREQIAEMQKMMGEFMASRVERDDEVPPPKRKQQERAA